MLNFLSVSISGAFNFGRARVLWHEGIMKVFNADGFVIQKKADKPKRLSGHIRMWQSETEDGSIILKGKCMTCGGSKWWKVYRASSDELWESVA